MGRKIFSERNFRVGGHVLPLSEFRPFLDRDGKMTVDPAQIPSIIARAEKLLGKEYPVTYATEYMMFSRVGNRSVFEAKYFPRRKDLLSLAVAEFVEGKGRFLDAAVNLVWMILEETSWVLPAHNRQKPGLSCPLPYAYTGKVDYIDLFAATTGADLAVVYYLLGERIAAEISPIVTDRILYELRRRIIDPYLDMKTLIGMLGWAGVNGGRMNNWCPWITTNILTVAALTLDDTIAREAVVRNAISSLDAFTASYQSDGGCDEGPNYWHSAGGALFNGCELLYDMTGGYINVFDDILLRRMGEYEVKVVINGPRVLNFADSPCKVNPDPMLVYDWGVHTGSEMMRTFGQSRLDGKPCSSEINNGSPYRSLRAIGNPVLPPCEFVAPLKFYFDGITVAGTRECTQTDKGLYLAIKGGNNDESHNHNDLGTVMVFADGNPIFIDAGSGKYSRRSFSSERYDIWSNNSEYHNVANVNGCPQKPGAQYRAENPVYDEKTGKLTLSLLHAYPEEAGLSSYEKSAELLNGKITIVDDIAFTDKGTVTFRFLVNRQPETVSEHGFTLYGRTVTFDPSLTYSIEPVDSSASETCGMPRGWDCDVLYRISLSAKEDFKARRFVLTVG